MTETTPIESDTAPVEEGVKQAEGEESQLGDENSLKPYNPSISGVKDQDHTKGPGWN